MASPVKDKLALFADRFAARTDVYAVRWENRRSGAAGWMPAVAGGWRKGMNRQDASYLRLSTDVVGAHLVGGCLHRPVSAVGGQHLPVPGR